MAPTSNPIPAAPMQVLQTIEAHSDAPTPRPRHPSVSSFTTRTSASTVTASGSQARDSETPQWLRQHMISWRIPPTSAQARAWLMEAFDYFNSGRRDLPNHLVIIESQLRKEWRKQNAETLETVTPRAKRKLDDGTGPSPGKRTNTGAHIKSEETSAAAMPPPSRKPLGTLKGKYAIETSFKCCDDQTESAHETLCNIVLSPGDGTTMRGHFNMGFNKYVALMLFEKRPLQSSSKKVPFKWRGRQSYNKFEEYRGDDHHGWMKFLGAGMVEVWFDKFNIRLIAQKGRGVGERQKHNAAVFWEDWRELDHEDLDLLDRLNPYDSDNSDDDSLTRY
ncbi:hypothetical protein ACHAPU_003053 [Fusarium lateritium]